MHVSTRTEICDIHLTACTDHFLKIKERTTHCAQDFLYDHCFVTWPPWTSHWEHHLGGGYLYASWSQSPTVVNDGYDFNSSSAGESSGQMLQFVSMKLKFGKLVMCLKGSLLKHASLVSIANLLLILWLQSHSPTLSKKLSAERP